jgi:hypothetical protein
MMTSCGGGSSKKSGNAEQAAKEIAEDVVKNTGIKEEVTGWTDNEFTKQVPKPDIAINAGATGIVEIRGNKEFAANFDSETTKEQLKAYAGKLKKAGFTKKAYESDSESGYSYNASNDAGYKVGVMTKPNGGGFMSISKNK